MLVGLARLHDELSARAPHELVGTPSVHASLIEGGTELSTYPDHCVLKVERRTLPGETVALVEEELRAVADGATVTTFFARDPLETRRDAAIVELLVARAAAILGAEPELVGVPFWTDAALVASDAPGVVRRFR